MTDAIAPDPTPRAGGATALRAFLGGAIDYAGLFPPASRTMPVAVSEYADHRASDDRWALGRFVIPAARLAEMEQAMASDPSLAGDSPWRLSATIGDDGSLSIVVSGEGFGFVGFGACTNT